MAQAENPTANAESFTVDPTEGLTPEAVDNETPRHVHVEINNSGRSLMAILAAGEAGRWSFDFRIENGEVAIVRAYEEGMRMGDVGELPAWVETVCQRIADVLEV